MSGKFWWALETAGMLLLLPAVLAHEATHYLAARGVAQKISFDVNPREPGVWIVWDQDAPEWRVRFAKVAPTIVGLLFAPLVLLTLFRSAAGSFVPLLLMTVLWAVYTKPSADDLTQPRRKSNLPTTQ